MKRSEKLSKVSDILGWAAFTIVTLNLLLVATHVFASSGANDWGFSLAAAILAVTSIGYLIAAYRVSKRGA